MAWWALLLATPSPLWVPDPLSHSAVLERLGPLFWIISLFQGKAPILLSLDFQVAKLGSSFLAVRGQVTGKDPQGSREPCVAI